MFDSGVTTVRPCSAKGCGWLTSKSSVMLTTREPWDTAAGMTRTWELITTVPVRELMMTFAGASPGATSRFSMVERKQMRSAGRLGRRDADRGRVHRQRGARAEQLVDAVGEMRGGGEVRLDAGSASG